MVQVANGAPRITDAFLLEHMSSLPGILPRMRNRLSIRRAVRPVGLKAPGHNLGKARQKRSLFNRPLPGRLSS